jgi:AAA+ ATPase superfamily predicted ATPase
MSAFIGRAREQKFLEDAYRGAAAAFVPVYGRRRVGKSELILHFLRDRPGIYVLGKKAPAAHQIREFLEVAGRALGDGLLAAYPARDWKAAFEAVVERWTSSKKLVLALDEFQWMVESSPELPSVLQELWDRRWRAGGKVFLILCGSYVGFMEREVLGKKSPLFGRRTGQIFLKPFSFQEAAAFHPGWSLAQNAAAYFICGGVPLYLKAFASEKTVEQNIARCFFDEFSPLFREPDFLLREELREVETYHAVLTALASGPAALKEIALRTGGSERGLSYYLKTLEELGYIARRYPLWEGPRSDRQGRYKLHDPLLKFWFRFIFPNVSLITQWEAGRSLRELVKPGLDAFFGGCFEDLCREALPSIYAREGLASRFEVGDYWDKKVQVDVVGLRADGAIDLGECKWGAVRSPAALSAELEAKKALYPNPQDRTIFLRAFTRERSARVAGIRWHDLQDLYDATPNA